jgi:hypothetical protein
MRVLACVLVLAGIAATTAASGVPTRKCPGGSFGSIRYVRGQTVHEVPLATCTDRVVGSSRRCLGCVPGVTTTGKTPGVQRLFVHGRLIFTHWETGAFVPLKLSGDGRWLFFFVDEYGSQSAIADGIPLLVVSTRGGPVRNLGSVLPYPDYLSWCSGRLVYTPGTDRVAIHGKRLVAAAPPDWQPRPLWDDPARTFASPACQPSREAVAVLTQHTSAVANFFATRWRLWRVGLDGSRHVLDVPPRGWADEQPTWAPDGNGIAFVRERNGYGRIMVRRNGRAYGPLASLGYGLGYYGHHDWGLSWPK